MKITIYSVFRVDLYKLTKEDCISIIDNPSSFERAEDFLAGVIKIKEVLPTREEAIAEVERNQLNIFQMEEGRILPNKQGEL
jgi:hypothetical protein